MVSIIIPSYNEREGIEDVLKNLTKVLKDNDIEGEIVVVDDDSPDKTWELCESLTDKYPLKVIRRVGKKGLSSAVIDGWKEAGGDILGVMDADGQHDEKIIPQMVKAIEDGECELAIGSRYVKGGGTQDWPWFRIFTSKTAIAFSRPITNIKDSTAGFCLFKKEIIDGVELNPVGWKIVLEVAIKGNYDKYKEFPYIFRDREKGRSKLGKGAILNYLQHVWGLWKWMRANNRKKK